MIVRSLRAGPGHPAAFTVRFLYHRLQHASPVTSTFTFSLLHLGRGRLSCLCLPSACSFPRSPTTPDIRPRGTPHVSHPRVTAVAQILCCSPEHSAQFDPVCSHSLHHGWSPKSWRLPVSHAVRQCSLINTCGGTAPHRTRRAVESPPFQVERWTD